MFTNVTNILGSQIALNSVESEHLDMAEQINEEKDSKFDIRLEDLEKEFSTTSQMNKLIKDKSISDFELHDNSFGGEHVSTPITIRKDNGIIMGQFASRN